MSHNECVRRHLIRMEARDLRRAEALRGGADYDPPALSEAVRKQNAWAYLGRCKARGREAMGWVLCTWMIALWAFLLALLVGWC